MAFVREKAGPDSGVGREVLSLLAANSGAGVFLGSPTGPIVTEDARRVPVPAALSVGARVGPYEVLELLGAGGMGEVYRARDERLRRDVAIKVLPASFAQDTDRVRRFEREARAAAGLSHPNIMAIHDVGLHEGVPYLVAELLEGETLRSRLDKGALPVRKAIDYAIQIARGLTAAHEKGIVHRDLKPANLFLAKDGRVKILDFGLAKATRPERADAGGTSALTAPADTEAGMVMGTAGYMSPEQVLGHPVEARSDLFSFGSVFYEMLSGRRAFARNTPVETMSAILNDDPPDLPPSGAEISPALARIVFHCLEKNPEERFQSARDLAFALASLSVSSASGPTSVGGVPGRRRFALPVLGAAAAVAALLVLGVGGGWLFARRAPPAQAVSFHRLTFRRGDILSARFATDGQTVVYSAALEGKPAEIFSVRTDSRESRPQGVSGADVLSVSSKGELALLLKKGFFVRSFGTGTLARMPLGGSTPREIMEKVFMADWAPNGEDMAVVHRTSKGKYHLEYPIDHELAESPYPIWGRVSPSGDLVAYAAFESSEPGNQATLGLIDRSGVKRTLAKSWPGRCPIWARETGEIYFVGGHSAADLALRAVSLAGRERVLLSLGGADIVHDVAADGRLLLERATSRRGISCLARGESRERELGWLDRSGIRDLSEDGKTILFAETGEGGGSGGAAFLRKTDGSPAVRLGDGDPQELSPDGKWALLLTPTSPPELLLLPTGTGSPRKVPIEGIQPLGGFFLPDGRIVFYHSAPGKSLLSSVIGPEGGRPTSISTPGIAAVGGGLALSRDSTLLAYETTERQIAVVPISGGPPRAVPGAILEPTEQLAQWSADGRYFFTVRRDDARGAQIWRLDVETRKKTLWKEIRPADSSVFIDLGYFSLTRDGLSYAIRTAAWTPPTSTSSRG